MKSALILAASITFLLSSHSALAATFVWDPLLNAFGGDGDGPWDNTPANWASDGADGLTPIDIRAGNLGWTRPSAPRLVPVLGTMAI